MVYIWFVYLIFAAIKYVLKFNNFKITETGIDEPIHPNYLYLITVIEILLTSEYLPNNNFDKNFVWINFHR